jgi:hypothetical protein
MVSGFDYFAGRSRYTGRLGCLDALILLPIFQQFP